MEHINSSIDNRLNSHETVATVATFKALGITAKNGVLITEDLEELRNLDEVFNWLHESDEFILESESGFEVFDYLETRAFITIEVENALYEDAQNYFARHAAKDAFNRALEELSALLVAPNADRAKIAELEQDIIANFEEELLEREDLWSLDERGVHVFKTGALIDHDVR